MARKPGSRDSVARLMVKALRQLPLREQDVILRGLFATALAGRPRAEAISARTREMEAVGTHLSLSEPAQVFIGPNPPSELFHPLTSMLPVRLSTELHERLRRWSTDHGFAMAVVVRGLIERFLEQQGRAAS